MDGPADGKAAVVVMKLELIHPKYVLKLGINAVSFTV